MISYNSKEWLGIFRLRKIETLRRLTPWLAGISIYTAIVVFFEKEYFQLDEDSPLRHIMSLHTLIGFAISMLLVFRTNTAYDRWWEGRRLWGNLINQSRNLALKLMPFIADNDSEREYFATAIPQFAVELMNHLHSDTSRFELDERPHPEIPDFDTSKHLPAQAAGLMINRVQLLHKNGTLPSEQLLALNPELSSFMDICGGCERIRNTPIPYSYSLFIKQFIFIYVVTLPFSFTFLLGWLSVPIVALIFFLLASLEVIAEEIEEPFGTDQNDLPLKRMCHTINKTVREILATPVAA